MNAIDIMEMEMKKKILEKILRSLVLQGLVILFIASFAMGDYELVWDNVQPGGVSSGGEFAVSGTIEAASYGVTDGDGYYVNHGKKAGNIGCEIDLSDLEVLAANWLENGDMAADIDGDGVVAIGDFAYIAGLWYETCPME